MFDAQLLMTDGTNNAVYSPWFPRQGDNAKFTVEIAAIDATSLQVAVFTKNSDATSDYDGTQIPGASQTGNSQGLIEINVDSGGIQELVRYKFTITGASGKWALFRVLSPVWYDTLPA